MLTINSLRRIGRCFGWWALAILASIPFNGIKKRRVTLGYEWETAPGISDLVGCIRFWDSVITSVAWCRDKREEDGNRLQSVGNMDFGWLQISDPFRTDRGTLQVHFATSGMCQGYIVPSSPIARWICSALYALETEIAPPTAMVRSVAVTAAESGPAQLSTLSTVSRYRLSIRSHFSRLLDLAAMVEATAPPLKEGENEQPRISFVVPVYNAPSHYLDDLLRSFRLQPDGRFEIIFCDDASPSLETREWLKTNGTAPGVRVIFNKINQGIASASNAGIAAAVGDWVAFLDHDDAVTPFALARILRTLDENPCCQFLYTDEVITDERFIPEAYFLKPAWNPVLLSGVNYINHLSVYRKDRIAAMGAFRLTFDGSQDYDFVLRYTADLQQHEILHLPYPAYLWRRSGATYSVRHLEQATANARRALKERYSVHGPVEIEPALQNDLHRVRFDLRRRQWPRVSVVLPNKDSPALLRQVLDGLYRKTDYADLEVIVIDNGSDNPETLALYLAYEKDFPSFKAFVEPRVFNFSAAINLGTRLATGDFVLSLNNDIEILEPSWLQEMVSCFDFGDVGIVGAKLLYPDQTIQHAGVIAGLGGLAGHWFIKMQDTFGGPMGRLSVRQAMSCVTGACMLMSRRCMADLGDWDESNFAIAYNDVNYCLRAGAAGYQVIWTPFARLVHHESATRGSDETPQNIKRFRLEQANLKRIHQTDRLEDRALNPWYSRHHSNPFPVLRKTLPDAR